MAGIGHNRLTRAFVIDQATTTGWAFADEAMLEARPCRVESGRFRMPKRDQFGERLSYFRTQFMERVEFYKPDLIAFEEPYWPAPETKARKGADGVDLPPVQVSMKMLKFLQRLAGVVECTCADLGLPYEAYASSSWRVTALGFGRKPKGAKDNFMKKAMVAKARSLGLTPEDDNEADAIGILLHALCGPPANDRKQGDLLSMARVGL